jgi:ribosomal protein S6--L-glutamate ligase
MHRDIRFGVVTAWPEDDWHSRRLLAACLRYGEARALDPASLAAVVNEGGLEVSTGAGQAGSFDAFVLARGLGRRGDPDVQFEIYRGLESSGAVVVNRIDPLLAAQDKFRTSWLLARAGVPTPAAAVAQSPEEADRILSAFRAAVVKPIAGSLGEGVERIPAGPAGRALVHERLSREGVVYLQAYVAHPGRDARLFVVGGKVRAAVERRAPAGEWRTNLAGGAAAVPIACAPPLRRIAEAAAAALGLDYAGVDVVVGPRGPTVIEVNGNPSWLGILEATGKDMAEEIAEYVLGRALRRCLTSDHIHQVWTGATHG